MGRSAFQLGSILAAATLAVCATHGAAQSLGLNQTPRGLGGVGVSERLGAQVPLDLEFTDSAGRTVPLSKYFGTRPVILVLGYYSCPLVCPLILDRLVQGVNGLDYTVGREFNVVVVSFDPRNTTQQAAGYRREYVGAYDRGDAVSPEAWSFHTANEASARALAEAVGFEYNFIPEAGEYAHPVALTLLTGEGVVSRYLYGFDYNPRDLKLGLLEAGEGRIARSLGDRLLLFCYHFDPTRGTYSLAAFRVMQAGAATTALAVGGLLGLLWVRERRRSRKAELEAGEPRNIGSVPVRGAGAALAGHHA